VIAAGVLAYGIHDLQEAGVLPGINTLAWDIEGYRVTSWYGSIIKGVFNLGPQMTVLEVVVYFAYLVPTMVLFLRPVTVRSADAVGVDVAAKPNAVAVADAAR
jgi:high-affinity iron transporter